MSNQNQENAILDDFNQSALDTSTWTVFEAGAGADVRVNAGNLELVSSGNNQPFHQNTSTRVMRAVEDKDFTTEVKFARMPSGENGFQMQGVLIEEDAYTLQYSEDGANWTTAGTITSFIKPASTGPFSGSYNSSSGFTAQIDYFQTTSSPAQEPENDNIASGEDIPMKEGVEEFEGPLDNENWEIS